MTVVLPRPGKNVEDIVARLTPGQWNTWTGGLAHQQGMVQPQKFRLSYKKKLNDVLKTLGMEIAFESGRADFSAMYKGPDRLFISKVEHKTFVEVTEEGTEAAAVTSVKISLISIGPCTRLCHAGRPPLPFRYPGPGLQYPSLHRQDHEAGLGDVSRF